MMSASDLPSIIALSMVPHIGDVHMKTLMQHFPRASDIFRAKRKELERIPGIGTVRASSIRNFRDFSRAEKEIRFLEKFRIRAIHTGDEEYPKRLLHCADAPVLFYYRGNSDLNEKRILSIVGTRDPSDYGREWVALLLEELAAYRPLIVSGLAYGIDTIAHRKALKNGLQTVGIMAHGLDRIYPHANKTLAGEMILQGGLLTDFMSGTPPDAQNFPRRNRIVAGIADAVIVVETGDKGGSMITADIANSYNKDVFALPGRVTDNRSRGCNRLIREHKAQLVSCAGDIVEMLNWDCQSRPEMRIQRTLFNDLGPDERKIMDMLTDTHPLSLDDIRIRSGLKAGETATAILSLEMMGLIRALPGKIYRPE
jgi:DNA processing protein